MGKGLEEHREFKTGSGWMCWGVGGIPCPGLPSKGLRWKKLGVSRNGKSPVDSEWAEEGETWRGLRGMEGTVQGEGTHSHLRSSRLLLGQARCWPGGFWVLCRQASMAELGACGVARSAAGSL